MFLRVHVYCVSKIRMPNIFQNELIPLYLKECSFLTRTFSGEGVLFSEGILYFKNCNIRLIFGTKKTRF